MTPMIARASLQVFLIADILFLSSIAQKATQTHNQLERRDCSLWTTFVATQKC
jgi:hypothetical protein